MTEKPLWLAMNEAAINAPLHSGGLCARQEAARLRAIADQVAPEEPEPVGGPEDYATLQGEFEFAHKWAEWRKGQLIRSKILAEAAIADNYLTSQ